MKPMAYRLVAMLFALGLCFTSVQVSAAEKSFADTKVVLQISDNDPFKQTLVLNVANNLVKHYGPDQLFAENTNKDRIQSLADNGVRFAACGNTVRNMSKILGEEPVLNKNATTVSAGVVRILDLEKQGYKLIKP